MNLATAEKYAVQIASWLTPYCERLEIVGSIRRRRIPPEHRELNHLRSLK